MSKNVFEKLAQREHENDTKLGLPSTDCAHFDRRMHLMSSLTGGNGWSKMPKETRKFADGTTRGDRKRALRAAANAKVSEERLPMFMHSAARRRALADEVRVAA
ncbi:hypothetical protein [Agrobacterium tumefaciens]|uniref:hypothetical protein n=1 Tax=Agrobacterium tumefaciens TaxID=358 RepID=UPI000EF248E8|nr:hypothetical protein [Agrobacterium tumefaciens]AYM05698.1 hypothetical protein At1D1460_14560 [Agrobacterium tumefaciens]NSZ32522.1 hypothetical protein [Agrobacterium tumefaciens]QLG22144.1 hypothetical protein EML4_07335 [Agrobacterium tumefaciens]UXS86034.1 hypothetical protein FY144_07305 [Agrobacterium tumefaciens]